MMTTLRVHSAAETTIAKQRFAVAGLHLSGLAGLLHFGAQTATFGVSEIALITGMLACSVIAAWLNPGSGLRRVRGAVLPCLSLPPRDSDKTHAWLPWLGWRAIDDSLRHDVEKRFALPMVGIALLVLPLFAVEHFMAERIAGSALLEGLLAAASAAVWAAFTFEFVVRCTIAEKKFAYIKQHWLDAVVILLPLIAFLRAARLARLAQVQKTARVFRLRGMAMRLWKAVVLFDLLERVLFRTPEKRLAHLEKKRAVLLSDLEHIDTKIADLAAAPESTSHDAPRAA